MPEAFELSAIHPHPTVPLEGEVYSPPAAPKAPRGSGGSAMGILKVEAKRSRRPASGAVFFENLSTGQTALPATGKTKKPAGKG